jgi:membrane protease YdiL (CAAX protease family)
MSGAFNTMSSSFALFPENRSAPILPVRWYVALIGSVLLYTSPAALSGVLREGVRLGLPKMAAAALLALVWTVLYTLLVRIAERRTVHELATRRLLPDSAYGVALTALVVLLVWLILLPLGGSAESPVNLQLERIATAFSQARLFAVMEELIFRGLLFRLLLNFMPMHAAVWLQALAFGAAHYERGLVVIAFTGVMGAGFGYAFVWRGTLWTPIAVHLAWDFVALLNNPEAAKASTVSDAVAWAGVALSALLLVLPAAWLAHTAERRRAGEPQKFL